MDPRPLMMSTPFLKIAESSIEFKIHNLTTTAVYVSEKFRFSEIDGYWSLKASVEKKSNVRLTFVIESNLPNLKYDRYIVDADVVQTDQYNGQPLQTGGYFLKNKLDFTYEMKPNFNACSFAVKLSLSRCPTSHECVDTTTIWKQIINNNISMLNLSTYSDFSFVVEGKEFKVHKSILAAASPVFVRLFNSNMQETIENKCIVNNITSDTFNHLLRFIYGGLLPDQIENIAFSLYEAAHYYDIKNLMDVCKKTIRLHLSVSNAVIVYRWAELYNLEDLKSDALKQFNIDQNELSSEMIANMMKQKESELLLLKSIQGKNSQNSNK